MYSKAVSVTIYSILHVLINFVFQAYLAYEFGAQREMDAYLVSTTAPLLINMIMAGSLTFPFLANFVHVRQTSGEKEALEIAFGVLALSTIALLIVSLTTLITARGIVRLTSPGLDATTMDQSTRLLQIQSPAIILWAVATLLTSLYNGLDRFVFPVVVQVASLAATCLLAVILVPLIGITAVAISVLIGALIQCLWLTVPLLKRTNGPMHCALFHPAVQRVFLLAAPLAAGALFIKTDALVDRFIASSLPEGSISHLGYAWRVMVTVSGTLCSGLVATSFPAMCALAAEKRMKEFHDKFVGVARLLIFVLFPSAILLTWLGTDIVSILFERGKFTHQDTVAVVVVMACYIGLLFGHGLGQHLNQAFFAIHDTRTPTMCMALGFAIGIALKIFLVVPFSVGGLALGTSVYYIFNITLVCMLLFRRLRWPIPVGIGLFFKRISYSALVMALGIYATQVILKAQAPATSSPTSLIISAITGVGLYMGLAYLLNVRECQLCVEYTRMRLAWSPANRAV